MIHRIYFFIATVIAMVMVAFFCVKLPTNPELKPTNAYVRLFLKDGGDPVVDKGTYEEVGLEILLLRHLDKITVASSCGNFDTSFLVDTSKLSETIYFTPFFDEEGQCSIIVNATMRDGELKDRSDTLTLHILPEKPGIRFIVKPSHLVTTTEKKDTLLFITHTAGGVMIPASYTLKVTPESGSSFFTPKYSLLKDTVRIVVESDVADSFALTLVVSAQHTTSTFTDTAEVGIRVKNTIAPAVVIAPQQLVSGKADTLKFIVDNSSRSDKLTITMTSDEPLDPAVFSIVPSGPDSLLIAVSATATSATANIGIIVRNGIETDTSWYPVALVTSDSTLWNTASLAVEAVEGKEYTCDLKLYLITSNAASITITSNIGAISAEQIWSYTPSWGQSSPVTATITAKRGDVVYSLTLTTTILPGDSTPPVVRLSDPTLNGKKVSTSQITVECVASDSQSGIESVCLKFGTETFAAVLQHDSIYSSVISGLQNGVPAQIVVTAIDKSIKKNSVPYTFMVTYDSTILAPTNISPEITQQPAATLSVVAGGQFSLTVVASGVPTPSFQWYKDNQKLSGDTSATLSKLKVTTRDAGTYHVVVSNGVGSDKVSTPSIVTVKTPANITQDPIAQTVLEGRAATFTVVAEGDTPIVYQWLRGASEISGAAAKTASYSINSVTNGDNNSEFKCVVSNNVGTDTSAIALLTVTPKQIFIVTFNTDGGSEISEQSIKQGNAATRPLTDPTKVGYVFSGWYSPRESTTPYNFNTPVDESKVIYAKWTALPNCTVTFDHTYTDTLPNPVFKTVLEGAQLGTLPARPAYIGYVFAGWFTERDGESAKGTEFTNATTITGNIVLYPKWEIRDRDNNLYTQVKIGSQIWMVENLKVTQYNDGSPIDASCTAYPNGSESNVSKFGLLYNLGWFVGEIAPPGWRIPVMDDFKTLQSRLIGNVFVPGGPDTAIAKSLASTTDWIASSEVGVPGYESNTNNKSGFNALPAGDSTSFVMDSIGNRCSFWTTSTEVLGGTTYSIYYSLSNYSNTLSKVPFNKNSLWLSIRLVREKFAP